MSSRPHIPALDGLRGIAVLGVMAYHFPKVASTGLERIAARLTMPGQTGVDLFFVLSGFLITGILIDSTAAAHSLRTFYLRRVLRIFPLYYATLLCLFILLPAMQLIPPAGVGQQLWFWLYLQNIGFTFFQTPGPNHFWSLAVEEQFYLVWPLVVMYGDRRKLAKYLFAAIAIAVLSRWGVIASGHKSFYFTLCRLDGLALGGLLALATRSPSGLTLVLPYARRLLLFGTPPLILSYAVWSGSNLLAIQLAKTTITACMYAALLAVVLGAAPNSILNLVFSTRVLRSFGKYSYALYILHPFIFAVVEPQTAGRSLAIRLVVAFGATYLAALVSWHFLERPFLRLKNRCEYAFARSSAPLSTLDLIA